MSYNIVYYNIALKIKGFDTSQIEKICTYVVSLCEFCNVHPVRMAFLPVKQKHLSVCRSPHIHKKSRTQVVYKRHKVNMCFDIYTQKSLQEILFFFKTSTLPGIEYEIRLSEKTPLL